MEDLIKSTIGDEEDVSSTDILSMALEQSGGFDLLLLAPSTTSTTPTPGDLLSINTISVSNTGTPGDGGPVGSLLASSSSTDKIDLDNLVDNLTGLESATDLSVLLNDSAATPVDSYLDSFVSEPTSLSTSLSTLTTPTQSTPGPQVSSSKLHTPLPLASATGTKNKSNSFTVNDILQQLGINMSVPPPTSATPSVLISPIGQTRPHSSQHGNVATIRYLFDAYVHVHVCT